ncbi:MAG: hypothetical protein ACP5E3_00850 [Bacteroidales bacterium]
MKRNYLTTALLLFLPLILQAQSVKSIYTIRSEFNTLSEEYNDILQPYDSLISQRSLLYNYIDNEINIYKACPTAYSDKIEYLEKKGDRKERALISEYRSLEFEKDNLENQLILNIRSFNNWNSLASLEAKQSYDKYIRPEIEQQQIVKQELLNYIKKIDHLQKDAELLLEKYDSCRMHSETIHGCEEILDAHGKKYQLAEAYMEKYKELLAEKEEINTLKKEGYINYRECYGNYYENYLTQKSTLNDKNTIINSEIDKIKNQLSHLEPEVRKIVLNALEADIKSILKKELASLNDIDQKIENEFGSFDYYYKLKELQRVGEIMVATLNPEINYKRIVDQLKKDQADNSRRNPGSEKALSIAMKYTLVLEDLKTAIANYDAIPYFCLNAYPQYSNDVVDENLEIINMKLDFQSENLEVRTEKFLEVSELDLSNTEFSLDLIFKGHQNLEKLNLSNTQISSLKYLAETNIRWLDLSNTEIDRNDLEYLKYMDNIEYLNLSNTGVKKKDIYDLCYHLKVKRKNCIAR